MIIGGFVNVNPNCRTCHLVLHGSNVDIILSFSSGLLLSKWGLPYAREVLDFAM